MADQTADDVPFVAETSGGEAQVLLEVVQIRAAHVTELHVLEVRPDAFVRIEIGSVAGQLSRPGSGGESGAWDQAAWLAS
jgi:hypothetical protein